MSQRGDGQQLATSRDSTHGKTFGERQTHGDAKANKEEVTYETLFRQAELQIIAEH